MRLTVFFSSKIQYVSQITVGNWIQKRNRYLIHLIERRLKDRFLQPLEQDSKAKLLWYYVQALPIYIQFLSQCDENRLTQTI